MNNALRALALLSVVVLMLTGCKKYNSPTAPQATADIGTFTVTQTISPTYSATLTATISNTLTNSPTATPTFTFTASPTITPLYERFRRGVYPDASYSGVSDAEIWSNTPDTNYGGLDAYGTGAMTSAGVIIRSLVKYDVSSILTGVYVVKSSLIVQKAYCVGIINPLFYPLNNDFVEGAGMNTALPGTVTWNSRGPAPWTNPGGDGDYLLTPASAPLAINNCGYQSYTFTMDNSAVEGWINTPANNHGVILIAADEVNAGNAFRMSSSEATNPDYRPMLEIYYYR